MKVFLTQLITVVDLLLAGAILQSGKHTVYGLFLVVLGIINLLVGNSYIKETTKDE